MNKIKYTRKTNSANLPSDSTYKYTFFMTPTSLTKRHRFTVDAQRTHDHLFNIPLNEIKYNKCVQFETIITTILSYLELRTRSNTWLWDRFYSQSKNELRDDWEFLLNKTNARNQFYREYNTTHYDKRRLFEFADKNSGVVYNARLPARVELSMYMIENKDCILKTDTVNPQTMVLNDIDKYFTKTFDDITSYIFHGLRVLLNGKDFNLVLKFLDMFESFLDFDKGIYVAALESINDSDYDKFSYNFGVLVNHDTVTKFSDLNDNIMVDLPVDSIVTNTHCIYKFFEALNATKNRVLLIPNKKSYHKVKLPTVGVKKVIDTFNVYFETKDDVEQFNEIYMHYNSYSEIVLCHTTIDDCQNNNGDYLNVHEYDFQHTQIFKDKLSKSSIPINISNRKTPYSDNIHGYIHLGTLVAEVYKDIFENETLLEYLGGIEKRLRKLGIKDDLVYSRNIYYTFFTNNIGGVGGYGGKYISSSIRIIDEKHGKNGLRFVSYDEMCKRYSKWYNKSYTKNSQYSSPVNRVHFAIPIRCVGDRMDEVLTLIRRQKLTNDLGGFRIQSITIAPYAPHDSEATNAIVDAISEL